MPSKRPQRNRCPLCQCELELKAEQLVCLHCLVIWHGDTFETIPFQMDSFRSIDERYQ